MTNELKGDGNELSTDMSLSDDINTITAEINAYQRVAGEAIFEIGRRLKHVKENDLAHGEFGKWLESIGIHERQAQRLIKVAEEFGTKATTWSDIPFRNLYEIATLPEERRNQTHMTSKGEEKKPEDMTVKELREVKRQLKQEKEAKEQAESMASQYRKSSEIERKKREEAEDKEPEVRYETRTEYVEIEKEPEDYEEVKRRVKEYESKFGDIRNYGDNVTATHMQEMISASMSLNRGVKEFVKRFSYMTKYKDAINRMDHITKREYNESLKALKDVADSFEFVQEDNEDIIINQ